MSTKTPITVKDARAGDLIRNEWDNKYAPHRATEFVYDGRPGSWYGGAARHFLLDRPKKIIHAKGTTLYARSTFSSFFKKGDAVIVSRDCIAGDRYVYVNEGTPEGLDGWGAENFTTEKPRKIKWAKGTKLWFVDSAENRALYPHKINTEHIVEKDVYEDDDYYVDDYFASRFTDVEPITLVAVPLTAIKKLRDDNDAASSEPKAVRRSYLRHVAVHSFLDERSIRLALGEDEQPW